MSQKELTAKIKELKELKLMAEDLDAEITAAEDAIKAVMGDSEELRAGEYKVTWKSVKSSRFDSTAFKATHADLYGQYTRETTTRRFCVA